MSSAPQAVIIAGPNGSGKSTAAKVLLPEGMTFVNADLIAQEISGETGTAADISAGRLLLERVAVLEKEHADFALETTLATRMLVERIHQWKARGYTVRLFFFYLPADLLAIHRVAARVRAGGHDVPEETVRRRFRAGMRNFFELYMPLVDSWRMYDNSRVGDPELIASGRGTEATKVLKPGIWESLVQAGRP